MGLQHINVTGEWFEVNWTTSMPKSVPRLVLEWVRLVPVIQMCYHSRYLFETHIHCYFSMKY